MRLRFSVCELRFRRLVPLAAIPAGFLILGTAQAQCVHQTVSGVREPFDTDRLTGNLRQISKELNGAVNLLHKHLDEAITRYDRGYRSPTGGSGGGSDGKRILGADANLALNSPDIVAAQRLFMLARMLAAAGPGYAPAPLADSDHIQDLVCEARQYVDLSNERIRQLLVVSVDDLNSKKQTELKASHDQLLKARSGVEEAMKMALVALPLDLSEVDPEQTKKENAWDLLEMGGTASNKEVRFDPTQETSLKSVPLIPVRVKRQTRITLMRDLGHRLALTDSGTIDRDGRHIFRQEEWVQRGKAVIRMRWRVGVDTQTGQHILLKQYAPREYHGDIEELYQSGRDYLWYLEPVEGSAEPSRDEMETALQQVAQSRDEIRVAVQEFKSAMRGALTRNESQLDTGLPDEVREKLFAIRGHVAGTAAVLNPEARVRHAVQEAAESIGRLEPLAAWANQVTPDTGFSTRLPESEWGRFEERSDDEIDLTQAVRRDARALLPPDNPAGTANFPALYKDVVARVVRRHSRNESGGTITVLQDLWILESHGENARRVRRSATLISIDLGTGSQTLIGGSAKYYAAGPDDTVEEVFGRYAAQDLVIQALQP